MRCFRSRARKGSVLVEFALISLVLYVILAATLTFGLMLFQANVVQQAVDAGAQEIARMPLPPAAVLGLSLLPLENLDSAVNLSLDPKGSNFRDQIYDEQYLYVDAKNLNGQSFFDYAATLPLINRLLVPAMIFDQSLGSNGVYRFPGAVVQNNQTDHLTVLVPLVKYDFSSYPPTGTITWVMPVEEVLFPGSNGKYYSQFDATLPPPAPGLVPGIVALRINLPCQSAAMSGFSPGNPNLGTPIPADESALTESSPLTNYSLVVGDNSGFDADGNKTYGGKYGLGRQFALPTQEVGSLGVRPFRKVISVQAVYRRESFGPP
jgi:hypothetical protein